MKIKKLTAVCLLLVLVFADAPAASAQTQTSAVSRSGLIAQISQALDTLRTELNKLVITLQNLTDRYKNYKAPELSGNVFLDSAPIGNPLITATGIVGSIIGNTNWVGIGDFNGDGSKDVFDTIGGVSIFNTSAYDALLINDGVGNLVVNNLNSLPYDNSFAAGVADFDNDGDQDIYVANFVSDIIIPCGQSDLLYLNDGTGNFQIGLNVGDSNAGADVEVGDMNGDGLPDVAVANVPYTACGEQTSKIYFQNPHPTRIRLIDATAASLPGPLLANKLELTDIDGDGDLDLITTTAGPNPNAPTCAGVRVFKNNGQGIFTEQNNVIPSLVLTHYCYDLEAVDLDNDGDKDLVITNPSGFPANNGLIILRNNGNGVFSALTVVVDGVSYPNSIVYPGVVTYDVQDGDVNGDGRNDLFVTIAVGNYHPTLGKKFILLNNGNFNFTKGNLSQIWSGLTSATFGMIVHLFDANNDNKLDVLLNRMADPGTISSGLSTQLFYHL